MNALRRERLTGWRPCDTGGVGGGGQEDLGVDNKHTGGVKAVPHGGEVS